MYIYNYYMYIYIYIIIYNYYMYIYMYIVKVLVIEQNRGLLYSLLMIKNSKINLVGKLAQKETF